MSQKVIIFGNGALAELADFYLTQDKDYSVEAFTVSADQISNSDEFQGRPLVTFDNIEDQYPPDEYAMFVAIGYRRMNKIREEFCNLMREKGYRLISYVHPSCITNDCEIGDNVFIFENVVLQPFVKIGDGVIIWSNSCVCHHTRIEDYAFLATNVSVSGFCTIGKRSFIGVGAALGDSITIGQESLLSAGSTVTKDTVDKVVIMPPKNQVHDKSSDEFLL